MKLRATNLGCTIGRRLTLRDTNRLGTYNTRFIICGQRLLRRRRPPDLSFALFTVNSFVFRFRQIFCDAQS